MRKSKVSVERYDLSLADLVKVLSLGENQRVTDICVGGAAMDRHGKNLTPWTIQFIVETTESTTLEVPIFAEK